MYISNWRKFLNFCNEIYRPFIMISTVCGFVGSLLYIATWFIDLNHKIDNLENKIISRIESEITDEIIARLDVLEKTVNELKNKNSAWGEETVLFYIEQALQGDIIAQYRLGLLYHYGAPSIGIEQSYAKAFNYYTIAAKNGVPEAQYSLGLFYQNGLGGNDKNETEAAKWFALAKERGVGE